MRAFLINGKLNIGKINHIELDASCISGCKPCKVNYFLLSPLTCVRWCMEIHSLYLNSSSSHHVSCNRAVNSSRKQAHSLTCCANRQTSLTLYRLRVNICLIPKLYCDELIRILNIYTKSVPVFFQY